MGERKVGMGVEGVGKRRSYCEFGGVIDGSTAKLYLVLLQGPQFHPLSPLCAPCRYFLCLLLFTRNYRASADTESRDESTPAHAATMAGKHEESTLECAACAFSAMASAGCFARRPRLIPRFRAELRRLGACADGCCRARAEAPSHQISTTG